MLRCPRQALSARVWCQHGYFHCCSQHRTQQCVSIWGVYHLSIIVSTEDFSTAHLWDHMGQFLLTTHFDKIWASLTLSLDNLLSPYLLFDPCVLCPFHFFLLLIDHFKQRVESFSGLDNWLESIQFGSNGSQKLYFIWMNYHWENFNFQFLAWQVLL